MKPDINISSINVNGTLSNNSQTIAKAFNNYFISVAQNTLVDDLNNENISYYNNNNNNNNNMGSRGMGEVAPLYGVDSALVLTNPGVQ